MVTVLRIKLTNLINLYRILHKQSKDEISYYCDFKESFIKYFIMRQCYCFVKNDLIVGFLLINRKRREIIYIPIIKDSISLFRLFYILNNNFTLKGYTLTIKHKKINSKLYRGYLPVDIFENYKYMYLNTKESIYNPLDIPEDINVRRMVINKEETIRVKLQNNIFGNTAGRRELTLIEIFSEERKGTFLKDMCFILDVKGNPGGYGQILIVDEEYYLVNFGVTTEYRKKGFGEYFLSQIINSCNSSGIEHLNLCVDNDNIPAVNLYKKIGFKELYNKFSIRFK